MRSFAIDEPGLSVRALYATLMAPNSSEWEFAFYRKIKKGPEKSAQEYPFGRGGWGVKNYLGDALMPGL